MLAVEIGLANAFGEITLVFFTTLAPSATLAYLLALVVYVRRSSTDEERKNIRKQLWIPLMLAMLGLIAAATHLGNPANALYVLAHVGESPLSNEMLAAVAFLTCAAIFWLAGFSLEEHKAFDRVFMALIAFTGVALIVAIALAYNVETIITWHRFELSASIAASSFMGGPLIVLLVLRCAHTKRRSAAFAKVLAAVFTLFSLLWLALHVHLGLNLGSIENSLFSADELVPLYWPALVVSAILLVIAGKIAVPVLWNMRELSTRALVVSIALTVAAIFIMRFGAYMMHMTLGVAV